MPERSYRYAGQQIHSGRDLHLVSRVLNGIKASLYLDLNLITKRDFESPFTSFSEFLNGWFDCRLNRS